jgi:hypothetical protein
MRPERLPVHQELLDAWQARSHDSGRRHSAPNDCAHTTTRHATHTHTATQLNSKQHTTPHHDRTQHNTTQKPNHIKLLRRCRPAPRAPIETPVLALALHCVGLAGTRLAVREDANVVAVEDGRHLEKPVQDGHKSTHIHTQTNARTHPHTPTNTDTTQQHKQTAQSNKTHHHARTRVTTARV